MSEARCPATSAYEPALLLTTTTPARHPRDRPRRRPPPALTYAIAIHGGAGTMDPTRRPTCRRVPRGAAPRPAAGRDVLAGGGTAVDAVEAGRAGAGGRRALQRRPRGRLRRRRRARAGRVDHGRGHPRLRGRGRRDHGPQPGHPGPPGDGPERPRPPGRRRGRAVRHRAGVDRVDNHYFDTPRRYDELQTKLAALAADPAAPYKNHGTVGAVALDVHGHLAAATSTGGMTAKRFGRVGDSPLIGAGTYADDRTVAVSCTGVGEQFIRHAVAYDVSARVAYRGQSVRDAVDGRPPPHAQARRRRPDRRRPRRRARHPVQHRRHVPRHGRQHRPVRGPHLRRRHRRRPGRPRGNPMTPRARSPGCTSGAPPGERRGTQNATVLNGMVRSRRGRPTSQLVRIYDGSVRGRLPRH